MAYSDKYLALMGQGPKRVPHWEHWSCPDAESYLAGVDYYDHPRQCRQKLADLYPQLELPVFETDDPRPRPVLDGDENTSDPDSHAVRWGDGLSWTFEHGEKYFKSLDDVLKFSPLEQMDFTDWPVVESHDYSDEDALLRKYRQYFPAEWGDSAPDGEAMNVGFYNTLFMWPMLTFGWEYFLEAALEPEFERIMDEFAELSRRIFRVFCKLPVNFVVCHDDIVTTRGPVCSPTWMKKYIFPRYEEYWSMLRESGKRVIFMVDGCMDAYADDVITCGASGIVTEPYTDFKAIARKHENVVLAGEGDNRILSRNNPDEIRAMVDSMVETAKMTGGYFMCVGNHIPWNVSPEGIKTYLDYSAEVAYR